MRIEIDTEMEDAIELAMADLDKRESAHKKLVRDYLLKLSKGDDDDSLESELVRARRLVGAIRTMIGPDGELVSLYYKTSVCRSLLGPLMRGVAQTDDVLNIATDAFEVPDQTNVQSLADHFPLTSLDM